MNSGRLFGQAIARNIIARRAYGGGHHHRAPTMNDLPKPEGDFFIMHAARQRTHNGVLAFGVLLFASTVYITYESNLIHFNYSPPDTYE